MVAMQVADHVIADLVLLIDRRPDDLDAARLMEREQLVGVADEEYTADAPGFGVPCRRKICTRSSSRPAKVGGSPQVKASWKPSLPV